MYLCDIIKVSSPVAGRAEAPVPGGRDPHPTAPCGGLCQVSSISVLDPDPL